MKNFLLASLSGLLLAFAWPTYGFPLLLFFSFVPLLFVERNLRIQHEPRGGWLLFGLSFWSFLIWNIISTYWIYYSTAAGMVAAILLNSLFMTLVFSLYHLVAKRTSSLISSLSLVGIWVGFENLHLHWDLSWPWLNLGNGFSEFPKWIQWYAYTGSFGGTLWVWGGNLILFLGLLSFLQMKNLRTLYKLFTFEILWILIPIFISLGIWKNYSEKDQNVTEVLILQPDIDPYNKTNINDREIGDILFQQIQENITDSTELILAPETVFANGTRRSQFDHSAAEGLGQKIISTYTNTAFLAGISEYDIIQDPNKVIPSSNLYQPGTWINSYNSAFMISAAYPNQFYNKSKLVVGVEMFPYQNLLKPLLGNIMIDLGGTASMLTTQEERTVFKFDDAKATAPIICYESVYGDFVNGYVKKGAQFLAVITNDAWWKNTQGHKQHVSYARLRAIETRRDVAQSANNGTSAIINQRGQILKSTSYGIKTTLRGEIHLNEAETFYTQHGDYLAIIAETIGLLCLTLGLFDKRKENKVK